MWDQLKHINSVSHAMMDQETLWNDQQQLKQIERNDATYRQRYERYQDDLDKWLNNYS